MRLNFLLLAGMMLLLAAQRALRHDYCFTGLAVALACATVVVHFIRVRRFKRFDTSRNFD
jgi:hypothetical protein